MVPVAVIDGPYDAAALSGVLPRAPVNLGNGSCRANPGAACNHGTFVMGLLGRCCPGCQILHVPLFVDERAPAATVSGLANAIRAAVASGARLINLSLAIQGDDSEHHPELGAALDYAEAEGAVVVVAAGNQGRLAMGQLLSHPVTIPVVAVDAAHRLLPSSNFGPSISRRGVAAYGHQVVGPAPGGGEAEMSGTSAATAVATGILADFWSARPDVDGHDIRTAIAQLAPRNGPVPPRIHPDGFPATLGPTRTMAALPPVAGPNVLSRAILQGEPVMHDAIGHPKALNRDGVSFAAATGVVTPAHGPEGCSCGAPGGICACQNSNASSRFVYALGTVDIHFPDQSIVGQLETVAQTKELVRGHDEDKRAWCYRVLKDNPDARHVARLASWVLTVEGIDAYYLVLRDLNDLDTLIKCLDHPRNVDLDLFVGSSSLAPVERCAGVKAPILVVEHLSTFKRNDIVEWFKKPSGTRRSANAEKLNDELFEELFQGADNFGQTDWWRALNYLAVRYPQLHECFAEMAANNHEFKGFSVDESRLAEIGPRRMVDPVFSFQHKDTGVVQRYYVRVDVTYLFPMLVRHIAKYKKNPS
jgi:hypothetical protein